MQALCVIKKRDSIPFTCSSLVIFSMCDLEQSQAAKLPGKAFLPESKSSNIKLNIQSLAVL